MNPNQGWIVINTWLQWETFDKQFDQLISAAADRGVTLEKRTNSWLAANITSFSDSDLPAFAIAMDKDIAVLRLLEARGVPVFNKAQAVADCDDKSLSFAALEAAGVAQPATVVVPLRFQGVRCQQWQESGFIDSAVSRLGLPLVAKLARSSWGQGVELIETRAGLCNFLERLEQRPAVLQEFVSVSAGRDARLYFAGDECLAAMIRTGAEGDFRSNIAGGGHGRSWEPSAKHIAMGRAAKDALGLDFAGIDLLFDADELPLVCEVNSNAQFMTLAETTGIDVARGIIDYILDALEP